MNPAFRISPIVGAILLVCSSTARAQAGTFSGSIERDGGRIAESINRSTVNLSEQTAGAFIGSRFELQNSVVQGDVLTGNTGVRASADSRSPVSGLLENSFTPEAFTGPELVTSRSSWSAVVTNNSAVAQQIDFSFYLPQVELGVSRAYVGYVDGAYQGNANFKAAIKWGAADVWGLDLSVSAKSVDRNSTDNYLVNADISNAPGYTRQELASTNFPIFATQVLYGDPYAAKLDLGTLASGESRTLTYSLQSQASYIVNTESESYSYGGLAWSTAVDPLRINRDFGVIVSAVPEPQTYAMLLVGVLLIGSARRLRQQ
jgi:hypothetical protein